MGDSDWDSVTVLRKKAPTGGAARGDKAVAQALRSGATVETSAKYGGGGNRQGGTDLNTARLDEETEKLSHKTVSLSVGKAIMKGRNDKKLTQKDLAQKINEKPQVINEYESSKAIPNQQILGKLERVLGIKLRGKDIGAPLAPPGAKK